MISEFRNGLINRRRLLAGTSAVAAAMLGWPISSLAAGGKIIVANWGGDWNDRTVKFFEAPIVEKAGYTVVHELGSLQQRLPKFIAESRLPTGSFDVLHFAASDAALVIARGLVAPVDENNVPRLAKVPAKLKMPGFVPWQFSGWVIGYNPEKIPLPPKSFADLWDSKYANTLGLTDVHWYHHMEMAGLVNGGSMTDIAKIKSALMDLKKAVRPKIYPSHLAQAQALKNGEIALATNYKSRIIQFNLKEDIAVQPVYPSEGAIAITYGLVVSKKAPNMEGALFYANALLDPVGMAGIAQESFYSPAVADAVLPADLGAVIEFSEEEKNKLHPRDHEFWLKNRSQLLEWWNQEFKA